MMVVGRRRITFYRREATGKLLSHQTSVGSMQLLFIQIQIDLTEILIRNIYRVLPVQVLAHLTLYRDGANHYWCGMHKPTVTQS